MCKTRFVNAEYLDHCLFLSDFLDHRHVYVFVAERISETPRNRASHMRKPLLHTTARHRPFSSKIKIHPLFEVRDGMAVAHLFSSPSIPAQSIIVSEALA